MYNITFKTENSGDITVPAVLGENLMELAQSAGVYIDAPCSGNGTCGKCRLRLESGSCDMPDNQNLTETDFNNNWRLACQSTVTGDADFFVPATAKSFMSGIKTADFSSPEQLAQYEESISRLFGLGFPLDASLEYLSMTLTPPSMDDTSPDNERLISAVKSATGFTTVHMSNNALITLPETLREYEFSVKCSVRKAHNNLTILEVLPPNDNTPLCGIAIDIGTTTVSAALVDLTTREMIARASSGNAQIRYGADVINRIIQSTKRGGRERLMKAIRDETINPLIRAVCQHANLEPSRVYRLVIASNTTMNHLFAGVPANSIRLEPYVPVFRELPGLVAGEFELPIHPQARVVFAPNVGSYVGGDITAGTLATEMWNSPDTSLFIDLGTNGELVFGNEDYLLCCACSAGPAFEGGDITFGMRAMSGAVEACRIDKDSMEPTLTVVGDAKPIGICGSGIIDLISELFRCGIIDSRGKFKREGRRIKRDEYGASYVLAFADGDTPDIEMSEVDIDNFIRAKAAIYSAISSMLDTMDLTKDEIAHVYIAGGIGSGIDLEKAISIGMLPNLPLDKYSYIGNSSLTGACAMLLSTEAERKVLKISRSMTYLELSSHKGYMDEFVAACFLPHTDASLFPPVDGSR